MIVIITRQVIAEWMFKILVPFVAACLIVVRIPLLPRKLKLLAAWGLGISLGLIILRLALLAGGD